VRALGILRRVADDSAVLLGENHPDTLLVRIALVRQLGASGNPQQALDLARELAEQATEALGAAHEITLSARFEAAIWTRQVDGPAAGARLFYELIEYAESQESAFWSLIIDGGWNLGGALTDAGNANAALPILEATIEEGQKAYGPEHPRTLNEPKKAAELAAGLVEDTSRILGQAHLTTLQARFAHASWTAQSGNEDTASQLFETLQADAAQLFGCDHWLVVKIGTKLRQP
jgi:hypothetical protein